MYVILLDYWIHIGATTVIFMFGSECFWTLETLYLMKLSARRVKLWWKKLLSPDEGREILFPP